MLVNLVGSAFETTAAGVRCSFREAQSFEEIDIDAGRGNDFL